MVVLRGLYKLEKNRKDRMVVLRGLYKEKRNAKTERPHGCSSRTIVIQREKETQRPKERMVVPRGLCNADLVDEKSTGWVRRCAAHESRAR